MILGCWLTNLGLKRAIDIGYLGLLVPEVFLTCSSYYVVDHKLLKSYNMGGDGRNVQIRNLRFFRPSSRGHFSLLSDHIRRVDRLKIQYVHCQFLAFYYVQNSKNSKNPQNLKDFGHFQPILLCALCATIYACVCNSLRTRL